MGCCCLALYLATLQPDFGGPEDTPKFQFLGYVLGTAHPPGYPLYVWLSHLFVSIPIGSVAYRANLFSAVMAAASCAASFVLSRQIGAGRWASLSAALALAAGASFWRSAVFAEVYSLAAAVAALTAALLLAWDARPSPARLLGATAAFALGLGNHLTIVGLVPACLLFVVVRHGRTLTVRLMAGAFVILVLGLSQYGLIVVRTMQGAPYLESRASTVRDLVGVVTAERFAGQRFAFGPRVLLTDHLPAVAAVMAKDFRLPGVLLFAAGLLAAARTRNSGAFLLLGGAAGMLGMVLNLSGDLSGFITPIVVLLWPLTALGAGALVQALRAAGASTSLAAAGAMAAAAVMPATNLAANYRELDQSHQVAPGRFFRSAFRQLPNRAGVVTEDYFYDMALDYMLFTGEAGPRRGIVRTGFDSRGGPGGAHRRALPGGYSPLRRARCSSARTGSSSSERRFIGPPCPSGSPDCRETRLSPAPPRSYPHRSTSPARNIRSARPPGRPRSFETFAMRSGTREALWRGADDETSLRVDGALRRAPAFAGPLAASAGRGARIDFAGQALASIESGLVIAAFSPAGVFLRAEASPEGSHSALPFEEALYELRRDALRRLVTGGWTDVTPALIGGSWVATLPGSVRPPSKPRHSRHQDHMYAQKRPAARRWWSPDDGARGGPSWTAARSSSPNLTRAPSAGLCFV